MKTAAWLVHRGIKLQADNSSFVTFCLPQLSKGTTSWKHIGIGWTKMYSRKDTHLMCLPQTIEVLNHLWLNLRCYLCIEWELWILSHISDTTMDIFTGSKGQRNWDQKNISCFVHQIWIVAIGFLTCLSPPRKVRFLLIRNSWPTGSDAS